MTYIPGEHRQPASTLTWDFRPAAQEASPFPASSAKPFATQKVLCNPQGPGGSQASWAWSVPTTLLLQPQKEFLLLKSPASELSHSAEGEH